MLTLAPQLRTLKPPSTVLRLGQSRADPKQESPGADSRGTYCSSLDFTGMEVVQDLAELGLPLWSKPPAAIEDQVSVA